MTTSPPRFWSGVPPPDSDPHTGEPPVELALDQWEESKADFCARIAENKSLLKILLKTKDDHYFLEPWIEHHANIVGLGNLIIFDNLSTDERVRRTYARYQSRVPIIRFGGHYDRLHDTARYPELYECLERACEYYAFLDTDEFLVLLQGETYRCGEEILEFIRAREGTDVFPASWLLNIAGSDRRFDIGDSIYRFGSSLVWGKPIVRTRANVRGFLNHNAMLDRSLFSGEVPPNFFLLHLMRLFPQQRIDVNLNKLMASGLASAEDTPESVLARYPEAFDSAEQNPTPRFVRELRTEARRLDGRSAASSGHWMELDENGAIRFSETRHAATLDTFLTRAQPLIHAALDTDVAELRTTSFENLKTRWKERVERETYPRMVDAVKAIAAANVPRSARVAVVSKGDARLLEIAGVEACHFPQDASGAYCGWYPRDGAEAVGLVEALRPRGIEVLILPRTAFWWLDHYQGLREHLATVWAEIWRSEDCAIFRSIGPVGARADGD